MATPKSPKPAKATGIVHPKPTATVIKELYGTAFRCGESECKKPLYRLNDDTGETILNSEVAHIHARSEGGPRWKPGMSADDNRSPANLMPLCFEHAWEIDQAEDDYPAELLHEWKTAQLEECRVLQKSWTLTDAEAAEVSQVSFDVREHGYATASATAVMQTITEVGVLLELTRTARRGPSAIASEWRARQARANAKSFIFDSQTGERLTINLAPAEVRDLTSQLTDALATACSALEPQVGKIKGLALAVSVEAVLAPWCDWLERAIDHLMQAAARWPAGGAEDDAQLQEAIEQLRLASLALGQKARGLPTDPPPAPAVLHTAAATESDADRHGREHRELLENARRWARVDHLPFDRDLYEALVNAMPYAIELPTVATLMGSDLDATAHLAARVAKNADDESVLELIDDTKEMAPLGATTALLWNIQRVAEKSGRTTIKAAALEMLTKNLAAETWGTAEVWTANASHCRGLLNFTEYYLGTEHVRDRLSAALDADASLVEPMIVGVAQWAESRDFDTFSLLGLTCCIRDLPTWLPTETLRTKIAEHMPDLKPSDELETTDADPTRLAAQFLYLTEQR